MVAKKQQQQQQVEDLRAENPALKEEDGRKCKSMREFGSYCVVFEAFFARRVVSTQVQPISYSFIRLHIRYQRLVGYHKDHGDCLVPNRFDEVSEESSVSTVHVYS